MRFVISALAAFCLTLAALPASAQSTGNGALLGQLPETLRSSGRVVILIDDAGNEIARAPVSRDGRFIFLAVPEGQYTVALTDSTGTVVLARVPARAVGGVSTAVPIGGAADAGTTPSVLQGAADIGLPTALPFTNARGRTSVTGTSGGSNPDFWWCWKKCCWWSCHR